jgi:DNA-binding PadR family transcriptional regulator
MGLEKIMKLSLNIELFYYIMPIRFPTYLGKNKKFLTNITASDILEIDITVTDITEAVNNIWKGLSKMPESQERGALTEAVFYILLSLYKPLHGYGIMQKVKELSNERVNLGAGTLYGALNTLLGKNWIKSLEGEKDSRKKEYEITPLGKQVVNGEIVRLEELIANGKRITGGEY